MLLCWKCCRKNATTGICEKIYPNQRVRVNTIFDVSPKPSVASLTRARNPCANLHLRDRDRCYTMSQALKG